MRKWTQILLLLILLLASCGNPPNPDESTAVPEPTATTAPTADPTALPTPTATALPPLLILLAPDGSDPALSSQLQAFFSKAAQQEGLRYQLRQTISAQELNQQARYLIAMPGTSDLNSLVAGAPNTSFLAVGIIDLESAPNLLAIGAEGERPDQNGFIAGYIAAMLTQYWRVGVISVEDTPEGQAARQGFTNGVAYFCGLCRSGVPPFYEYPLFIGLPEGATDDEWRQVAGFLLDRLVETIFVAPGAGGDDLLEYLAASGVKVIGSSAPPESATAQWVTSIRRPNTDGLYAELWPRLLAGDTGEILALPIILTDSNEANFGIGKQMEANQVLSDILDGFADPGVTPIVPLEVEE